MFLSSIVNMISFNRDIIIKTPMCYWLQLILRKLALYMLHFCFNLYCCPWNQNVQRDPLLKISKQSDGRTMLTPPRLLTWLFVEISQADPPIMIKRIQNQKIYLLALLCLHARSNPLCAHSGHMLHSSVKSISNLMKKKMWIKSSDIKKDVLVQSLNVAIFYWRLWFSVAKAISIWQIMHVTGQYLPFTTVISFFAMW